MPDANAGAPHRRPTLTGAPLLLDPRWNKGTAWSERERDQLRLRGLLPPRVLDIEAQQERVLQNFHAKSSPLEQYIYLIGLQDRNEVLFYRTLVNHLAQMMPVIYTPTVGEACRSFGHVFRRARGLYISLEDRGRIGEILRNWPEGDVRVAVVTDGERILGIGDQGANGMGIPIGKLSLYTACAGIHPGWCLPVMLDVGTENEELRNDPLYLGTLQPRVRGGPYLALVDEFMEAMASTFPGCLVQFEDFATENALGLLGRYRDRYCTFNDDVQGTAAVALAGLLSATRITGIPFADQRILFLGAGSAATGIADLCVAALVRHGLAEPEARQRCWFMDSKGLVVASRRDLQPHKRPYAHDHPPVSGLEPAVRALRPTALLGLSTQRGAFDAAVLGAMADVNRRPVVFALSNPTSKSECTAEDAYRFTGGRAVFASGSPFGPVVFEGRRFAPGQGNNAYIFPGLGLGALVSGTRRITDAMFYTAAQVLANEVPAEALEEGRLYPALEEIRGVSAKIAAAVAALAWEHGLASGQRPADLEATVRRCMWEPEYEAYA